MNPLLYALTQIISLYSFILVVYIIVSLLVSFRVVNTNNLFVYKVYEILAKLCEPALRRIRHYIPDLGGLDISPIILLLALNVLEYTLVYYFA